MKLIIAGSRNLDIHQDLINELIVQNKLDTSITEVVSGGASGVDNAGERYASMMRELCGKDSITTKIFLPDWDKGKKAGPIRNAQMADYADALLLIWDGESRGSKNMLHNMILRSKPVYEVIMRNCNV